MNLHLKKESFRNLVLLTSRYIGIPEDAIRRDYYIVLTLQKLEKSEFSNNCVFKGGTSLSKCYPGTIMRFSEDIDLTYMPNNESDEEIEEKLNRIEFVMSNGVFIETIPQERTMRNKSAYLWFDKKSSENTKIKLEIGSSVRPDLYDVRQLKSYIQEYLESRDLIEAVNEFGLQCVTLNTLRIERTFLDKVMAVKRHAICGNLNRKVRHIYDVTMLMNQPEIKKFLLDKEELKRLVSMTKQTDKRYLEIREIPKEYNPLSSYDFSAWSYLFDDSIRSIYESLHLNLLYTDESQSFDDAIYAFREIDALLSDIGE